MFTKVISKILSQNPKEVKFSELNLTYLLQIHFGRTASLTMKQNSNCSWYYVFMLYL